VELFDHVVNAGGSKDGTAELSALPSCGRPDANAPPPCARPLSASFCVPSSGPSTRQ